jgi:superfamily II DNA or RNA helicase
VIEESLEALKSKNKLGLFLAPGLGKTVIALRIIRKYINQGKRVAVSAFNRNEIKDHWVSEIVDHGLFEPKEYQVIMSTSGLNNFDALPSVVNTVNVSKIVKATPLTIFIPQTVSHNDIGKFDLIVVDEAHQILDVEEGLLQNIIDQSSKKNTKLIGLTGTGHNLLTGTTFSKDDPDVSIIIRDVPFAIEGKRIMPVDLDLCYFDFKLTKECYNQGGDITEKGKQVLKSNLCMSRKLLTVLDQIKDQNKTLIICPAGTPTNQIVHKMLNARQAGSAVLKSSYNSRVSNEEAEYGFRYDPKVKFLVVVAMCGTGWNYSELDCVVDLTFTRNVSLMIQRISRACRYHQGKKPRYVYCADNSRPDYDSHLLIGEALALMRKDGIQNYSNLRLVIDEDKIKKSSGSFGRDEVINLGSIERYFQDKDSNPRVAVNTVSTMQSLFIDKERQQRGKKPAYHEFLYRFWRRMAKKKILADFEKDKKLVTFLRDLRKTVPEYSDLFQLRVMDFVRETYDEHYALIDRLGDD